MLTRFLRDRRAVVPLAVGALALSVMVGGRSLISIGSTSTGQAVSEQSRTASTGVANRRERPRTQLPSQCTPAATGTASQYGNGVHDGTKTLQAALDDITKACVLIDNLGTPWLTGPLFVNRDNLTVVFGPGVVVADLAGAFPGVNDSMITVNEHSNIQVIGYGGTLRMDKSRYTTGEFRHLLIINSSSNLTIEGLTLDVAATASISAMSTRTRPQTRTRTPTTTSPCGTSLRSMPAATV